jgi:glucose-1-phosphate cytidylyltransferase
VKVVLLAGGLGSRLAEETEDRPKPMVEIGGKPILWHIMKYYAHYHLNEFYIALGYKGDYIKRYFLDYYSLSGNITLNMGTGEVSSPVKDCEDWQINLIDTGLSTQTGGRLRKLEPYLGNETFAITYGDGLSNINLERLLAFHRSHGKWVTVSAVRPPARFGGLVLEGDLVDSFTEKPQAGEGWINGGFLIMEPQVFKYLTDDGIGLEVQLLEKLAEIGQLAAYRHYDFWQCMDTLRDKYLLEGLWQRGNAPWQVW